MNAPALVTSLPNIINYVPGMEIVEGFYSDMPEEVYFSTNAISVSGLKDFHRAPAKYRYGERKKTAAQAIGKLWHTALLEPNELDKRFMPTEVERRGTNDWKAAQKVAGDRELIKLDDWLEMEAMRESIKEQGGPLVSCMEYPGLHTELSFFWWDYPSKLFCRGRADMAILEHGIAADVKSCVDADEDFKFSVRDFLYHWQAAFYKRGFRTLGLPIEDFPFFAIEKSKPYLYSSWSMPESIVRHAENRILKLLNEYRVCVDTGTWPGYPTDIAPIPYPDSWLDYE